jgi:hypothetical protein
MVHSDSRHMTTPNASRNEDQRSRNLVATFKADYLTGWETSIDGSGDPQNPVPRLRTTGDAG